jgi:hypothetical protein
MLASTVQFSSYGRPRPQPTAYPHTLTGHPNGSMQERPNPSTHPPPAPRPCGRHPSSEHDPGRHQSPTPTTHRAARATRPIPQDPTACLAAAPTPTTRSSLTPPKGCPNHPTRGATPPRSTKPRHGTDLRTAVLERRHEPDTTGQCSTHEPHPANTRRRPES